LQDAGRICHIYGQDPDVCGRNGTSRGMSIAEIAEVLDETEERIQEIASAGPGEQAE